MESLPRLAYPVSLNEYLKADMHIEASFYTHISIFSKTIPDKRETKSLDMCG